MATGAIGVPFCWGGYGITYNADQMREGGGRLAELLFDARNGGRLSASARFEENIALAAILVTSRMGTQGAAAARREAVQSLCAYRRGTGRRSRSC